MFGLFSQNFVLLIAFGSSSPASSSVFALYRECSEISFQRCPTRTLFIRIFRVLNTVQSFIFKVHVVAILSGNVQYHITSFSLCQQLFHLFWKSFWFPAPFSRGEDYNIKCHRKSQQYFSTFFIFKNVNIKFDIFSCFYCFAVLHNT